MYLVILGHTGIKSAYKKVIYSFHMPLFFIISGMVFKDKEEMSMKELIKRKFKSYMIPYFFMHLIALPIWIINYRILRYSDSSLIELFLGALYSNNQIFDSTTNATWFLPTIFLVDICFTYLFRKCKNKRGALPILVILISSLSFLEDFYLKSIYWPWHLELVPLGISLYYIGYLFKRFLDKHEYLFKYSVSILCLLVFFPLGLYFEHDQIRISTTINQLGNPIVFYIVVLSFTIVCISIANIIKVLKEFKITKWAYDSIQYVGNNTILFIGLQIPIIRLFEARIELFQSGHRALYYIVFSFIIWFILIGLNMLVSTYMPFLIGKRWNEKKSHKIISTIICCIFVIITITMVCAYF